MALKMPFLPNFMDHFFTPKVVQRPEKVVQMPFLASKMANFGTDKIQNLRPKKCENFVKTVKNSHFWTTFWTTFIFWTAFFAKVVHEIWWG